VRAVQGDWWPLAELVCCRGCRRRPRGGALFLAEAWRPRADGSNARIGELNARTEGDAQAHKDVHPGDICKVAEAENRGGSQSEKAEHQHGLILDALGPADPTKCPQQ
jgi:hypothetical protein